VKSYLGVWSDPAGVHRVTLTDKPEVVLHRRGGKVSPLFRVLGDPPPSPLTDQSLVICYPASPRALLATLQTADARSHLDASFVAMTHGLGAVIALLPGQVDADAWLARWVDHLVASEVWNLRDGRLADGGPTVRDDYPLAIDTSPVRHLDASEVTGEVASEVEQFNRNLAYFWSRAERYAPEYRPLVGALIDSVEGTLEGVRENLALGSQARYRKAHYVSVSNLVEINSCLTMLNSQLLGAGASLLESSFGVGEYSLLGIGSVTRAAWRIYSHMNEVFARENHLERLRRLGTQQPFDAAHLTPFDLDIATWGGDDIDSFEPHEDDEDVGRQHVVYFSSRWGFHQTMQSISISWQCVHSAASPEWTLLTFSHEFLHSHLRELLDELLLDPRRTASELAELFNREPESWADAAAQLLIAELRSIKTAHVLEQSAMASGRTTGRLNQQPPRLTTSELGELVDSQMRVLEEFVVHVMDFIYFYDADDQSYVSSLWHSWALVPNVQPQLRVYLLRTLLALSSTWSDTDSRAAFGDAAARLENEFRDILEREDHGLVQEALDLLLEERMRKGLLTRFQGSFTLVKFVRRYLISKRVNSHLFDDAAALEDGSYASKPPGFSHEPVDSPIGFLLARFRESDPEATQEEVEIETLWQHLQLI
jgi:hypothetical protein